MIINNYLYSIIKLPKQEQMTDILISLLGWSQRGSKQEDGRLEDIQYILKINKIRNVKLERSSIQFILDFDVLKSFAKINRYFGFCFYGNVKLSNCVFNLKLAIFDQRGLFVRAKTPYQRLTLAK
jgi:hypothetical protein